MGSPEAATGAHLPTPTSHLCHGEGAGGRECKYAGTPLTRSKVCHCEVGSWRRLCVHPYLTICPSTKPLILPSTTPILLVPCSPLKTGFATVAKEACPNDQNIVKTLFESIFVSTRDRRAVLVSVTGGKKAA